MSTPRPLVFAFLTATLAATTPANAIYLRIIQKTGQMAPTRAPMATPWTSFRDATIDTFGNVAFNGESAPVNAGDPDIGGIWYGPQGNTRVAVENGEFFAPAVTFLPIFGNHPVAPSGVLFNSYLEDNNQNPPDQILSTWRAAPPNALGLVAVNGAAVPGLANVTWSEVDLDPRMILNGDIAFTGKFTGQNVVAGQNDAGLWTTLNGQFLPTLLAAAPANGTATNGNPAAQWKDFSLTGLNLAGKYAVVAELQGNGVNAANNKGIWMGAGPQPALLARTGSALPINANLKWEEFGPMSLNTTVGVATIATLGGAGANANNNRAIALTTTGAAADWKIVAQKGGNSPVANIKYEDFDRVELNVQNNLFFEARVSGPNVVAGQNDRELFAGPANNLRSITGQGRDAPGLANRIMADFTRLAINKLNQVAFYGNDVDTDNGGNSEQGIWATLPNGDLRLIVHEGDMIKFGANDIRTIDGFAYNSYNTNGEDGGPTYINDTELVFTAVFTDGSQAVLTATIPEPTSITLLFAALTLVPSRLRRTPRTN